MPLTTRFVPLRRQPHQPLSPTMYGLCFAIPLVAFGLTTYFLTWFNRPELGKAAFDICWHYSTVGSNQDLAVDRCELWQGIAVSFMQVAWFLALACMSMTLALVAHCVALLMDAAAQRHRNDTQPRNTFQHRIDSATNNVILTLRLTLALFAVLIIVEYGIRAWAVLQLH